MEAQTDSPLPPRFRSDEVGLPQHRYQPPISCSHGHVKKSAVKVRRVRLLESKDCGFTVGVVESQLPALPESFVEEIDSVPILLKPPPSRLALWLADQLDGIERACMPPESWIRVWHEWV